MPKRKPPAAPEVEPAEIVAELTHVHPRQKLFAELFAGRVEHFQQFQAAHPAWVGDERNVEELRHSVMALAVVIDILWGYEISYLPPEEEPTL